MKIFFCLILSFATCMYIPVIAEESLDKQIEVIQAEIEMHRRKAMEAEVDSQTMMLDNWEKFSQEIAIEEKNEEEVVKLKKQLEALIKKKQELSSKKSSS